MVCGGGYYQRRPSSLSSLSERFLILPSPFDLTIIFTITTGMYKAYLKRHREEELSTAHSNALQCVSPEIARALFKHSCVPGCEHFLSHAELKLQEQQNEIVAASVAISSQSVLMLAMIQEEEDDDDDDEVS